MQWLNVPHRRSDVVMLPHCHGRIETDDGATILFFMEGLAGWWLGVGLLLRRVQPGLARLSLALAVVAAVGSTFTFLDVDVVRYAGLAIVFALWTAWSICLLVLLWRRSPPFADFG